MRVLVTGASGFLGGRLVLGLVHAAYEVRAFVRTSSNVKSLPPQVELAYGDVRDLESLISACEDCDAVIHAGAMVGSWLPDPTAFYTVNVEGLKNVIEAVKRTPSITRLIYTSSYFAVGPSPTEGQVVNEEQLHSGTDFTSDYEKSKFLADIIARDAARQGVNIVLLYPGVIYGPGTMTAGNIVAEILIQRFSGLLPGYTGPGTDRHSFCHVDDVVHGHLAALQKGRAGERYLLTGDVHSFHNVMDLAAAFTGTSPPSFVIPFWAMTLIGRACVLWARLTGWKPLITPEVVAVLRKQWIYTSEKAEKELGYKSRPFKHGLAEILVWLKDSGSIKY